MDQNLFNSNIYFSQEKIATLLRVDKKTVERLQKTGDLPSHKTEKGYDPLESFHAYIKYKKSLSKKNKNPDGSESEEEKELRLKNEERLERIHMLRAKRVVFEKQYAPVDVLVDVMQQIMVSLRTNVDSWLPRLKMAIPDLPDDALDNLEGLITTLMNELTEFEPDLSEYRAIDHVESEETLFDSEEGEDAVGSGVGE